MSDKEKLRASSVYGHMFFELLTNIKAVNSGVFPKHIADMTEEEHKEWIATYEALQEAGWVPRRPK